MLENNNLKVCYKLVRRDFRLHKFKNLLLTGVVMVTALYTFVFLLGNSVEGAFLLSFQYAYGSTSHILYTGLTAHQADAISLHSDVKSTVRLNTLGQLSDEMIGGRSIKLAVTDRDYAQSVLSLPTTGRLPESDDEIALDEFTLDSLGIPHELGHSFSLKWTAPDGSAHTSVFKLSGWWASPTNFTEACAWISSDCAKRLLPSYDNVSSSNVSLGIILHQPQDLDLQAQRILTDLGISGCSYTTNLAYNESRRNLAEQEANPFYMTSILVVLCGFLMIYSILHVAVGQEIRFYASLKTLGMTPRQLLRMPFFQALTLCFIGYAPGWLLGFFIHSFITPRVVAGMEQNPALYFLTWWPFLLAALLTLCTTMAACVLPTFQISRMTPAQTTRFANAGIIRKKSKTGTAPNVVPKRTTLLRLAFRTLCRNKGQTLLSLLSLLLALLFLCASWIRYVSYDKELYLSSYSPWNYTIMDGSTYFSLQRYNPTNRALTEETVANLWERPEVEEVGVLKTWEFPMKATDEMRGIVTSFYNDIDETGVRRLDYMQGEPGWCEGFERFERTGEYIGLVVGLDGPYLDYVVNNYPLVDGAFDPEAFAQGNYVLTAGATSSDLSSLPAGAEVEIAGRKFEVMTVLQGDTTFINGSNSPEAEFNFLYYVPLDVFDDLFPQQSIRQLAVNIDPAKQKSFEQYLSEYERGLNRGISIIMRSEYEKNFEASRFNTELTPLVIGIVLMIIGFLNFTNMLVSKTLARQREFAVYESLGMTRIQLKKLLLLEGLLHAALLAAVLTPVTYLFARYVMPLLIEHTGIWCISYQFTLAPMWLTLPLLLTAAAAVQLCCLKLVCRGSLNDRLHTVDNAE